MKKTAAILLMGIFLFNWFGYRLLSSFLSSDADSHLVTRLEKNNFNESELVSLKLPANLPYYANSQQYERMDGQIEINGKHYNYVKRRFYNDSLEYLCIPNREKTRLADARNEFFKLVNDIQQPSQKKTGGSNMPVKNLLSEYYQEVSSWSLNHVQADIPQKTTFLPPILCNPVLETPEIPPDQVG